MSTHGFGPEFALARGLQRGLGSGHRTLIVKSSRNGSSLHEHWRPHDGECRRLISHVAEVLDEVTDRGDTASIESMLWVQGEADMSDHADAYGQRLRELLSSLRHDLRAPEMQVVIARTSCTSAREPGRSVVREAQVQVAESDVNADWIDTDDLPLDRPGVHLRGEGLLELGKRAADVLLASMEAD